jgi:DNA-binding response OmpR family regulator
VRSTAEALELLKKQRQQFHLIIIQAGPRPGRAVELFARALHVMLPEVRVLTIANAEASCFPDLNPAFQACLPKPFTLSALLKAARGLLDNKISSRA